MHRIDYVQLGEALLGTLPLHQRSRQDADCAPARGQGRGRDGTHQARVCATVDEIDLPPRQEPAQLFRRRPVVGMQTRPRSRENA